MNEVAGFVAALRRSPLFTELPDDALRELVDVGEHRQLEDGEVVMREGDPASEMVVVLRGRLTITRRVGDVDVPVNACEPGELVGELALVHGRERSATVRADGPTELLVIDGRRLDELLQHPGVARKLLATAASRLEQQEVGLRHHARMSALGTLTAGVLHELNNPAAAVARAVRRAGAGVDELEAASRALADPGLAERLQGVLDAATPPPADALARSDAAERLHGVAAGLGVEMSHQHAALLVDAGVGIDGTGRPVDPFRTDLADVPAPSRAAAVRWLAARTVVGSALRDATTAAERVSEIVAAVKAFSHHGEAPDQDVDVHAGLDTALTILGHRRPPGVEVRREYASSLPLVEGRPGELNGVWTNLLDNAFDAVGDTGTVTLRTRPDGDDVVVEVIDTGPGIAPEHRDRLFDPFFTTKPVGAGTGLGLASAFAIVTQHGGRLELTSGAEGTTASVRLPADGHGRLPRDRG